MITGQGQKWQGAHGCSLNINSRGLIMAIVNITPDSFSDGGIFDTKSAAIRYAMKCVEDGADILDVGGESTKPNADPVTEQQEQDRVLPIIEALRAETDVMISVDTYRASTANYAINIGANIVNDIYGLQKDPRMAAVVAENHAGLCMMHTGRERDKLPDIIADQFLFFKRSLEIASSAGVLKEAIVLDPGYGFAKDTDENVELMARFSELKQLGYPILAGTSRKRFVGALAGVEIANERDVGTAATTAILRIAGASIFRVHNVAMTREILAVTDAVLAKNHSFPMKELS